MSESDSLHVWCEQRRVGALWRNAIGAMGLRYDAEQLASGFAISQSLPLVDREFPPEMGIVHRFFANLLLEGGVRDQIVRDLRLPNTDFELADYRHMPAYEFFTMQFAAAIGLPIEGNGST